MKFTAISETTHKRMVREHSLDGAKLTKRKHGKGFIRDSPAKSKQKVQKHIYYSLMRVLKRIH